MSGFHKFLESASPELTLLSVLIALIGLFPLIKKTSVSTKQIIFSQTNNYYILVATKPLGQKAKLSAWDSFWMHFFKETSSIFEDVFAGGLVDFIFGLIAVAAVGWASVNEYNETISLVIAILILCSVSSVIFTFLFMKRVKALPVSTYVKYLLTCLLAVCSSFFIYYGVDANADGLWAILYYFLRVIGLVLTFIPVLLSTGSVISSVRQKDIVFKNDLKYMFLSFLSVLLCSDIAYNLIYSLCLIFFR